MASMALSFSLSCPRLSSAGTPHTHKICFPAPQSIRRRSLSVQMSKMKEQEDSNQPEVFRPLGNFSPCIWGETFANYTLDTELREKYSKEVAELKEQVRNMLIVEERKVSEKIILIDTIERLGVAYHFENEIEEILQQLFDNYDYKEDYDLYNVSLHFRIFRQHGHNMSCDIFRKYMGSDGKLQETLKNDVMGMLSLYEAANLAIHGEDILDEALVFTKTRLKTMIPELSSHLAEEVKRSLDICLHRRLFRIEARNFIEMYGSDPSSNETLLYFAKIDFNLVQMLHRQELSIIIRWWNHKGAQLPHGRDRVGEMYFWGSILLFEPRYSVARIAYTKISLMHLLLDDTYDSYGTLDELKLLTDAIEMWDANAMNLVPEYLKKLYKSLLDVFDELDHQYMGEERHRGLSCLKHETQDLVRSYYQEAKWWLKEEEISSFDEYLANGMISVLFFPSTISAILGMEEAVTNEKVFDWFRTRPKIVTSIGIMWRLTDDIETYEIEKAKGQAMTGIEYYINRYGVSKEDTVEEFHHMIEKGWKDFNEECFKSAPISKRLMDLLVTSARMVFLYRGCDPFTNPERSIKDQMASLLINHIPLA